MITDLASFIFYFRLLFTRGWTTTFLKLFYRCKIRQLALPRSGVVENRTFSGTNSYVGTGGLGVGLKQALSRGCSQKPKKGFVEAAIKKIKIKIALKIQAALMCQVL